MHVRGDDERVALTFVLRGTASMPTFVDGDAVGTHADFATAGTVCEAAGAGCGCWVAAGGVGGGALEEECWRVGV